MDTSTLPEIGMQISDCLNGSTATIVSDSPLRAHQISGALSSQGIKPQIEGAKPGLSLDFHASCVPQPSKPQVNRAFSPAMALNHQ